MARAAVSFHSEPVAPMIGTRRRAFIRSAVHTALVGAVVALAATHRHELADAARQLRHLRPVVVLVIPLFALWNLAAAIGWRRLIAASDAGTVTPSAWTLWLIRLQAQAVNLLVPAVNLGGEVLRATLLARRTGRTAQSTSAVVLDNLASTGAGALFSVAWLAANWRRYPADGLPLALALAAGGAVVALMASVPLVLTVAARTRRPVGTRLENLLRLFRHEPQRLMAAYGQSMAWHVGERMLTAAEIYIAMRAIGLAATGPDALFATAMMTALSLVFFFVPAQVGPADVGLIAAFSAIGLPPTAGLTVALVRRARQALVMFAGTAVLIYSRNLSQTTASTDGHELSVAFPRT